MKLNKRKGTLSWWKLSFVGVGCIIGTGYFLASSIAIQKAGSSVIIAYVLAALGTWFVFDALAAMTANAPEKGSFRTYAKQAFGPWAGFSSGWVYWSSEMLMMGSQLTALALFAQYWFPSIPLWLLASVFAALGLVIIFFGIKKVQQLENLFGVMKVAALVMFIIIAAAAMLGWLDLNQADAGLKSPLKQWFPNGAMGLWKALLFTFFAFGGIEVMGLMAQELKNPKDIIKSGKVMLSLLSALYLISFFLVITLIPIKKIHADESPFLTVLKQLDIAWMTHVFNGILIIAGFSTMVASLYAVTTILVTLAEEKDAPRIFAKEGRFKLPLPAFLLTTMVVAGSVVIALALPDQIFEYVSTAAGLMLLLTWSFILLSYRKLMAPTIGEHVKLMIALVLIVIAISGTLFDAVSRTGLLVSIGFILIIACATWIKHRR